jgi:hypothetical protein
MKKENNRPFEICALLGYYAALCGNCLPTFWDNFISLLALEDGTNMFSRNVSKQLPHDAA